MDWLGRLQNFRCRISLIFKMPCLIYLLTRAHFLILLIDHGPIFLWNWLTHIVIFDTGWNNNHCFNNIWGTSMYYVSRFLGFYDPPTLCVQMDFTRTFEANNKCNNINYVWSHFYQILVVLKYHRRLWDNIFNTDISRSINIPKNAKYTPLMWVFMHLKMSVSKILFHKRIWHFRTTKIW